MTEFDIKQADRSRILIADDEPAVRYALRSVIQVYFPDCTCDAVADGHEALEYVAKYHPGMILMDLLMPVMDGLAAFLEIQKLCIAANWEMPSIIFCTAYASSADIGRLIEGGTEHGMLQKPIPNDILISEVQKRLNRPASDN